MISLDRILKIGAEIFALSMFVLSFGHTREIQHFAAPPKGFIKYEIKTYPKASNFQIVGSLNPLMLLVNGSKIELTKIEEKIDGLKVAGKKIPTKGPQKTFFYNHIQVEQKENLIIQLGYKSESYEAKIPLSPLNLDFPYSEAIYLEEDLKKVKFSILKDDQNYSISQDNNFEIREGIISGLWQTRVINLPYKVTKTLYTQNEIILGLETAKFNEIKITGSSIKGVTNSDAEVFVNGEKIKINKNGDFEINYLPQKEKALLGIEVKLGDKNIKREFEVICPRFKEGFPWYKPSQKKEKFVEFAVMEEEWAKSSELLDNQYRSISHQKVRLSFPLSNFRFIGVEVLESYNKYDHSNSIKINSELSFYMRNIYQKDWGWFYGGDIWIKKLDFVKAGAACNFCENFSQFSIHLQAFAGRRFTIYKNWEWAPQFAFRHAITNALFTNTLIFEMLSFRYYF